MTWSNNYRKEKRITFLRGPRSYTPAHALLHHHDQPLQTLSQERRPRFHWSAQQIG